MRRVWFFFHNSHLRRQRELSAVSSSDVTRAVAAPSSIWPPSIQQAANVTQRQERSCCWVIAEAWHRHLAALATGSTLYGNSICTRQQSRHCWQLVDSLVCELWNCNRGVFHNGIYGAQLPYPNPVSTHAYTQAPRLSPLVWKTQCTVGCPLATFQFLLSIYPIAACGIMVVVYHANGNDSAMLIWIASSCFLLTFRCPNAAATASWSWAVNGVAASGRRRCMRSDLTTVSA